jgi:hypothetical protein
MIHEQKFGQGWIAYKQHWLRAKPATETALLPRAAGTPVNAGSCG